MLDIHSHLLPGLDDGSQSIGESLEIIDTYISNGYKGVIATPHHYPGKFAPSKAEILTSRDQLNKVLDEKEYDFQIYLGSELFLDDNALKKLENHEIYSMGGSKYILIEFPFFGKIDYAPSLMYMMQMSGYVPIIAHAERYEVTSRDMLFIEKLVKGGSLIQITLNSLKKERTPSYQNAIRLLDKNMVHFVATDTHSSTYRNPDVKKELAFLKEKMGEDWYRKIVIENPYLVLKNKIVFQDEIVEEAEVKNKHSLLSRFFRK